MSQQNTQVAAPPNAPAPSRMEQLKNILKASSVQEQFNNALKEKSGTFVASVIDLFNSDANLQQCDPKSVVMEALKAAVLNLPINKSLGFAYIVPYKKNGQQVPQFQPGYRGYIQLAMRTSQYRIINADVVLEGELRRKNKLTGEFDLSGDPVSDKIIGYFAHIEMINGFSKTFYMSKEQVTAHGRRYSKSFNNATSAWSTNFDEMAIKTVLRYLLSHYGFLSVEMLSALETEQEPEETVDAQVEYEINNNANKQPIGFTEEPPVASGTGNNQSENSNGPGF